MQLFDDFEKVLARLDRGHLDKRVVAPEGRLETVGKPIGTGGGVLAAVGDENRRYAQSARNESGSPSHWIDVVMTPIFATRLVRDRFVLGREQGAKGPSLV